MKFKSPVYSQASRSIAGLTYSHNRGGMYTRARSIPTNPNTPLQQDVKAIMAALSDRWSTFLSDNQRAAWELYSTNVQLPDVLGEMRNVGGIGMYCRSNLPRIQCGYSRIDNAPTNYDLGVFTPITSDVDTGDLIITFTNSDPWATAVGGALLVYTSQQQNPGVNYYKGPFRFFGSIAGAVIPPVSPASFTYPVSPATGNAVFIQYRVTQVDGRLSLPVILRNIAHV